MAIPLILAVSHLAPELAPAQLAPAALGAVLYAHRARTLSGQGRPVPGSRQASFYAGLGLIVLVLVSPLGRLSDDLLSAHMAEHLLMSDVGALLLVLGLSAPVLAPILRVRLFDRLRVLAHPLIALPLWVLDLYTWHLPVLYQGALHHQVVHAAQHMCFIGFGANMWMCLFGPLPMPTWFANLQKLLYIVAVRLAGAVLGNVFLWSGTAFYPAYARGDAYWHVAPLADQSAAGAMMMIEGSILTICLFAWLFAKTAREGEERQELLDFARARGVALSDQRAARAVSAGRGRELRERLQARAGISPDV